MNLIKRQRDVITGAADLENLHSLANFPIFMGCVAESEDQDIVAEMTWQISRSSGCIQLKNLIPLELLYQSQHSGAIGATWKEHHRRFAKFVSGSAPVSVVEIGGAHGILSVEYAKIKKIPWTIIEPNPLPVQGCTANFISGFFDKNSHVIRRDDTVIHSHVLEHIYEPDNFMKTLALAMSVGQHLVFSVPNMKEMLIRKYTNSINFEHTVFLTEPYIRFLLERNRFQLVEKELFLEDHSVFYRVERVEGGSISKLPSELYKENKEIYESYKLFHEHFIANANRHLVSHDGSAFIFGAHVFSQYLIVSGLKTEKILGIIDNDPNKQGKRLYGTPFLVYPVSELLKHTNPLVILRAGSYNAEIKAQILSVINGDVAFIE